MLRFSAYWKSLVGVRLNCTGTNILGITTLWKSLRKQLTWIVNTLHFHFSAEVTLRDFIFRITWINNTLNHIVPATFMRRSRIRCFCPVVNCSKLARTSRLTRGGTEVQSCSPEPATLSDYYGYVSDSMIVVDFLCCVYRSSFLSCLNFHFCGHQG